MIKRFTNQIPAVADNLESFLSFYEPSPIVGALPKASAAGVLFSNC
jgi:hypothetical protein